MKSATLPARPGQRQHLDLRSRDHNRRVDWIVRRLDYSADSKREIEREALLGYRHMTSHLDVDRHPFPVVCYDPVYWAGLVSRQATFADALYSSPPVLDYEAREGSPPEEAETMAALMAYHEGETNPRPQVLGGCLEMMNTGSALFHFPWTYEEQTKWFYQRQPMQVSYMDPLTGQMATSWMDEGKFELVKARVIVKDNPGIVLKTITQYFLDDTVDDLQRGGWVMIRDEISGRELRTRIKSDDYDRSAVERAIKGEMPSKDQNVQSLKNHLDWQQEVGLRPSGSRDYMGATDQSEDPELKGVEVVECWRRTKDGIERMILLNRAWIAWCGSSPYGHNEYPFALARNYAIPGQLYGLSDYRITRYIIRAIQTLRNAGLSEAVIAAMPPLLLPAMARIIGKSWEPRSEWRLDGCSPQDLQFFQSSGVSRQIAHAEADQLQGRMDVALGSSDAGRGGLSAMGAKTTATVQQIASEAQNSRQKLVVGNFANDVVVPWGRQWMWLCQQFQDYNIQVKLRGGHPVTIYPEWIREANVQAISTPTVTALKEQHKRRVNELYELAVKAQEPNLNRRGLVEMLVEATLPAEKVRLMAPEQPPAGPPQPRPDMMQPMGMGPGMMQPMGMGQGSPLQGAPQEAGPGQDMAGQAAADLQQAYAQ